MVDVRVTNSETRKSITVVAATAQALLEVVQSSRHFGPGTLEDASERLVSDGYALSDGLELTWFRKAAEAAQPPAAQPEWAQVARAALLVQPSQFKMSTMQAMQNKAQVVFFHCYRPEFIGPPFHLPASLGHQAFGHFRDIISGRGNAMPTQEAQRAALALTQVMPRQYQNETLRRQEVLPIFKEFLAPFTILEEHELFPGSGRVDGVMLRGAKRLAVVFEFKNEENQSYLQSQLYVSQFVNFVGTDQGSNPALMVELCGPSIRTSAVFATGTPRGADVRAVVCEPLTPHQHFFYIPYDLQHMMTLARTLDAIKAVIHEIMLEEEEEEEDTGTRRGAQLYTLPYPLRDVSKFVNVAHVGGTQYLYTATMLRSTVGQGPTGDSGVAAAQPEAQEQEQEFGQEVGHMPEGQPVLVKYTAHDYGEAAHRALAAQGLAPALHSCTTLQGGLVEVVMDHLSQDGGWHSLASLPPASLAQAAPAVLQAVNRMHAIRITDVQSGVDGPISHGDLRPANIMVRQQQPSTGSWCDVEVRFVDFDWACVDGAGTYPAFLNPELNWPSGVAAGKPITRQHDSEFLGNHLSSIQSTSAALPGAPPRRRGRGRASPKQPPQAIMGGQSIASRRVPSQAAVPQPHYPVRCSAQLGVGGAQVLRLPHTSSCRGGPHMRPAAGNLRHAGKVYLPL